MSITQREIDRWFQTHTPNPTQRTKLEAIAISAKELAMTIIGNTPESADQTAALRILREAVYTANGAILTEGVSSAAGG